MSQESNSFNVAHEDLTCPLGFSKQLNIIHVSSSDLEMCFIEIAICFPNPSSTNRKSLTRCRYVPNSLVISGNRVDFQHDSPTTMLGIGSWEVRVCVVFLKFLACLTWIYEVFTNRLVLGNSLLALRFLSQDAVSFLANDAKED
jgi:hypothetical protein